MQQFTSNYVDLRHAGRDYPISRRKLQYLIKDGRLPAYRLDGKLILKRSDIERLLTAEPVGAEIDRVVEEVVRDVQS